MIDEVRSAYTALRTQGRPDNPSIAVVPLKKTLNAYAGLDERGRQHLLIGVQHGTVPPVEIATLSIATVPFIIDGSPSEYLDVTCLLDGLAEVFDHFVATVLDKMLETGENAASAVSSVIEQWRHFLIADTQVPGRDKLAAVFGELLLALDIVHRSGPECFQLWVGPFGGRHDFRGGTMAIEVKTTRAHTARRVTIHGEDQLVAPLGGTLYLHFVRLEEVPGSGRSVFSLVDDLNSAGVRTGILFEALTAAGIPVAQLTATGAVTFDVRERLTILVDDQTPRIIPSSFVGDRRPAGVVDISYVIDLDHATDAALSPESAGQLLSQIVNQESP